VFQAEFDILLLKNIQESVESLYEDGQPLHYLESATSVDYNPNDARVSSKAEHEFLAGIFYFQCCDLNITK
jgi:hypothetical protein